MVICSVCLHTVPSELTECPFCESVLDGGSAEKVDEELRWEIVRTVSTEIEATLIAGRLRAYDIPAFVLSQVDSTRHFTIGALAVAKVFVPEGFLQQAQMILSQPPDDFPDDDENEPPDSFNETNR
jgi:hypothetical protein